MLDIAQINPYNYTKVLIHHNNLNNDKKEENNKNIFEKDRQSLTIRRIPRVKSALLFDAEKELKRVTLSSKSYTQYMKMNELKVNNLKNKHFSAMGLLESEKGIKSQRITNKKLPEIFYRKIENNNNNNFRKNFFRKKTAYYQSNKDIRFNDNKKKIDKNYINFSNISNLIKNKEEEENNNENNATIKETPYGFKYKETKIIYDKSKVNLIKSAIFSKEENNEYNNITEVTRRKSFKEKKRKSFSEFFFTKKEEEKNDTFKFFFEGDFLEKNKYFFKNAKKKEFLLKNEEAIDYLSDLYSICKNIEKFNAKDNMRKMKFDLKKYYHKEDFSFEINLYSICLKFMKQNELNRETRKNSQKIFLPFTYLLFFYLLDFETFKIFLSEILMYNEEKEEMEINQKEIRNILIKYKKYIQFNLSSFFNEKNKNKNKEQESKEKYNKITYNCNERNFLKIYDWIVHINSNSENKNIIYKMKIILPKVKFNLFTRQIKVKKYLHKNIIVNLLKTSFLKWEEKILCDLFLNKKFRYMMNSLLRQKQFFNSKKEQKIFLNKIDYNQNVLNKHKYEFFITDSKKENSKYLYFSSYEIIFFYGRNDEQFIYRKHINLKDSINLNKFSVYWGYINTIMKCLFIDKNIRKASFDFKILENSPTKFFKLKLSDSKFELNDLDKNNPENLKNFYNQGFMFYHRQDLLIDMYLINFLIIQPCIVRLNLERYNFKIPKELLNIITKSKSSLEKMNIYISEFSDKILLNKNILNINYEELKRRVLMKNMSKNSQDRLKTFTTGVINKSNTFKTSSTSNKLNMKRGISGNFGSLFGKSMFNIGENYKKSNTKKFGGSMLVNMQRIDEKKPSYSKKDNKRILSWKKLATKKNIEEKNENKDISKFNNDLNINMIPSTEEQDEKEEEEQEEEEQEEKEEIKEQEEKDKVVKAESFRKKKKKIPVIFKKFDENAEFFKEYIDSANKHGTRRIKIDKNNNKKFV